MQILARDLAVIIAVSIIVMILFYRKGEKQQNKKLHVIGALFFILAMSVVFSLTGVSPLSGFHTNIRIDEISYIPVAGTLNMIKEVNKTALVENVPAKDVWMYLFENIAGNILMFGPLGFFLPLLWKRYRRFLKTVLFGFAVSLIIEGSQLFLARGTDVDDLILNTVGTMLGFLAFIIFSKIFPGLSKKFALDTDSESKFIPMPYISIAVPYLVIVALGFIDRFVLL